MLKKILITLSIAILALVIFISTRSSDFTVTRNLAIDATKDKIFSHINDFHKWSEWSAWSKIDPNEKIEFEGSVEGVGAIMKWSSDNKEVGQGSMKIIESTLNESIKMELQMVKPFASTSSSEFSLKELNSTQTLVTWTMTGKKGFFAKAVGLFHDCSEMVGAKFDESLGNLRKVVESKDLLTALFSEPDSACVHFFTKQDVSK